ncbi:MAG TPA: hypothetical protein VEL79_21705 [Vicinamibacterales bacterium]|nr:hypothetical protein [Vicinamibacterales bacterium]
MLVACNGLDRFRRQTIGANHIFAEHAHASGCNGAYRIFALARHAELADQEDVELGVQRAGDLERDRDASPREPKHDNIVPVRIALELRSEFSSGLASIGKRLVRFSEHRDPEKQSLQLPSPGTSQILEASAGPETPYEQSHPRSPHDWPERHQLRHALDLDAGFSQAIDEQPFVLVPRKNQCVGKRTDGR